jgi:hypothetical protein
MMPKVSDEIMTCVSCNWSVLAKGDHRGWKGAELVAGKPLHWYCHKEPCQAAYDQAIIDWQAAHGYVEIAEEEEEGA